jgi:two-component system, response regulator, stage 0 sporulation protein F
MPHQNQRGGAPAIIIVDDDPETLFLIRRILKTFASDYEIVTCARGDVALERAAEQPTPLVITDYNLPGMNGLQLAAALKARAPVTRVVLMSGSLTPDLSRRAQDRGVGHVLPKPFHPDTLIQAVQAVLAA